MHKLLFVVVIFLFFFFPPTVNAQATINEFLPDASIEWIEFYNSSPSAEYIKDYYIDDDPDFLSDAGSSSKKSLVSLVTSNPNFPYIETTSFLNNSGDYVVLFDQNGNILDQYQFQSNPGSGISIGKYPDGSGGFFVLPYLTKSDANPSPPTSTPQPTTIPTQSPISTLTPTPTPLSSATPKATKSPTPKPSTTPTQTHTDESLVLGENTETEKSRPNSSPLVKSSTEKKLPIVSIVFIASGLVMLGFGILQLINARKNSQNT